MFVRPTHPCTPSTPHSPPLRLSRCAAYMHAPSLQPHALRSRCRQIQSEGDSRWAGRWVAGRLKDRCRRSRLLPGPRQGLDTPAPLNTRRNLRHRQQRSNVDGPHRGSSGRWHPAAPRRTRPSPGCRPALPPKRTSVADEAVLGLGDGGAGAGVEHADTDTHREGRARHPAVGARLQHAVTACLASKGAIGHQGGLHSCRGQQQRCGSGCHEKQRHSSHSSASVRPNFACVL